MREGFVAHYRDAPLTNGKVTTDPTRMAEEALAMYVDHRVTTVLNTLVELRMFRDFGTLTEKRLATIKRRYSSAMQKRVFGYSDEGLPFFKEERYTTRAMPEAMKQFADATILENRIHESFDDEPLFRDFQASPSNQQAPAPSAGNSNAGVAC